MSLKTGKITGCCLFLERNNQFCKIETNCNYDQYTQMHKNVYLKSILLLYYYFSILPRKFHYCDKFYTIKFWKSQLI